jgi:hypothetical protein
MGEIIARNMLSWLTLLIKLLLLHLVGCLYYCIFLLLGHLLPVPVGLITLAINYQAARTNHSMTIKRNAKEKFKDY